ncbi:hypothetical protein Tco_0839724 [Tanacetum coccineum]|uniref:Zinc finger, CCHC-type n=1 Tax=Tanacetum coccineum TaxID=301880 RepID=A0ABQ5AUL3_9ASTR
MLEDFSSNAKVSSSSSEHNKPPPSVDARDVDVEVSAIADILTKGLDTLQHKVLVAKLGMIDVYQIACQVVNILVFRSFFKKEKLSSPNFIDWYHKLRIVLTAEDKLTYLEHPIPVAPVPTPGQQLPPDTFVSHTRWVKTSKEISCLMLVSMTLELKKNLEYFAAYNMLLELKTMFSQHKEQELLQTVRSFHACKQ